MDIVERGCADRCLVQHQRLLLAGVFLVGHLLLDLLPLLILLCSICRFLLLLQKRVCSIACLCLLFARGLMMLSPLLIVLVVLMRLIELIVLLLVVWVWAMMMRIVLLMRIVSQLSIVRMVRRWFDDDPALGVVGGAIPNNRRIGELLVFLLAITATLRSLHRLDGSIASFRSTGRRRDSIPSTTHY